MKKNRTLWKGLACVVAAILFIIYFPYLLTGLQMLWNAAFPLLLGGCLAFLVNLIMNPLQQWLQSRHSPFIKKRARGLALLLSLAAFFGIIVGISLLVFPQLVESIQLLVKTIPTYASQLQEYLGSLFRKHPQIEDAISSLNIDWNDLFAKAGAFLRSGLQSSLNSVVGIVNGVVSGVVNGIIVLIFAIYILSDKQRFVRLYHRLCRLYLGSEKEKKLTHVLLTFDRSFRSFASGQCLDALILGLLVMAGMTILKLPYAPMIGTLVGVTNIIPMIGAFIGGGIGCFLVFTVSPMKALIFLIFLCVIQQIESNAIYPRIVGSSIGLPGIYVTIVIVIGGALAGVAGMVLGIPVAAAVYQLAKEHVEHKEQAQAAEKSVPQ